MHRATKAFFAALLLAGCSTGQPLQERNFAIVPGPAAVSPPLTRDLSEVISRTGNSYLTIVVSNTTERRSKTRDEVIVNNALTAGSGFLLDSDRVVTAGHVALRKALPVEARGPDGRLYTGTVLDVRPGNDMAILRLKKFDVGSPVKPAASACLKPGDTVFSLGKPHAMGDTARVGTVEAMSFGQKVAYQGFGYPDAMVVRMATRKGESGGPLFNDKGELVGMIVSTLSDQTGAPLNLAHAVTLPALADFICSTGDCPVEWAALRVQQTDNCPST
jgi:S1-C subfamily serine protease